VTDNLVVPAEERARCWQSTSTHCRSSSRRAFVVMPYGKKKDPRVNRFLQCDPAFHGVYRPLLEDFDLEWTTDL
jgi:hypothetical protein